MYYTVELTNHYDQEKGRLTFFESRRDIPFEIKRIYYINSVPQGAIRGHHAHKNLKQMLFCPFGKIRIVLDDGKMKHSVLLDTPTRGLVIGDGIWRTMEFLTDNAVLCVAASDYYDENDYIRDYNEFINYVESGYWKR